MIARHHIRAIAVDLPEDPLPVVIERAEVMFTVRVIVAIELIELHDLLRHRLHARFTQRLNTRGYQDIAADTAAAKAIVQALDALGLLLAHDVLSCRNPATDIAAGAVQVDAELLAGATMIDVEEAVDNALADIERWHLVDQLAALDADRKQQLFATLIASLTDPNSTLPSDILSRLGIDMAAKWRPDAVFFGRMTKAALLDLLREQCGEAAAGNCRKLAKAELAEEVARRLAARKWLAPLFCDSGPNVD